MTIWIQEFGLQLLLWLLGFLDNVFAVFRAIAGVDTVRSGDGEQTLTSYFLGLSGVQKAFWIVFVVSIGICAVCTVIAIVKSIINAKAGEPKSHVRTIGQSLSTVIVTLFMAMILIVGVTCADKLLATVDKAINVDNNAPFSHNVIGISVGDSYDLDLNNVQGLNKYDENGNCTYISYLYEFEAESDGSPKTYPDGTDRIMYLNSSGTAFDPKDIYFEKGIDDDGELIYELDLHKLTPKPRSGGGWLDDYGVGNLNPDITNESVLNLFGTHSTFVLPISWDYNGMISPDSFNFFVAYLSTVIVLIALIGATFGLVKRLFDIVILFIALPGIAATIPLDDGAKFKLWRETVISKVFLAFGTVLAVNVFTIVAPSLWAVEIPAASDFVNIILRVVLICGGALTISGGQLLIARLLGTSAEESREMGQSARTLFAGATTALGGIKAAGRLAFGTKNANGQRVGGLLKGGAGALGAVGGGAINAAGGLIGGQAYRSSRFAQGVSATQKALKGFSGSSGWVGKDKSTDGNTLGGAIGGGINKLGSKFAGSGVGKASGLNNGIVGAVRAPIDRKRAADRQSARNMLTQGSSAISGAYTAAANQPVRNATKPLNDDFGREVIAGFEGENPSALPAVIKAANKDKKE